MRGVVGWATVDWEPSQPFWHPGSVTSMTLDGQLLLSVILSVFGETDLPFWTGLEVRSDA